jgi:hypothetical protein
MNPIVPSGSQPEDPLEAWSESSVIIWQYNSTFYAARNMSTNMVIDLVSNLTRLEQNALGNMTTGLLYLIEVPHNTSLSITATQIVAQQIAPKLTYFTSTGSSSVTDCPVSTKSNFNFANDTTAEQTIITLTPASVEMVCNVYLDVTTLTQNCTLKVYITIGAGYVEMTSMTLTVAAGTKGLALKDMVIDTNWKLTITSAVDEGVNRTIPYEYFVNVY